MQFQAATLATIATLTFSEFVAAAHQAGATPAEILAGLYPRSAASAPEG